MDALGRVTNYAYDQVGNCTRMSSPDSVEEYTYDSLNRRIKTYNVTLDKALTYSFPFVH